ncbi:hypothetical protein [Sphingomonas japonica]|uniref:Uncharacterized protein n=1 Tax=Sphingomonas japonica TaxID=511662 RepID=A0ABX0TZS7_9SPHN|nr:hypothetical protein [Sphingomonas japonica]NIJ22864.1 hypothetical protein [Sphingomonas japonica]
MAIAIPYLLRLTIWYVTELQLSWTWTLSLRLNAKSGNYAAAGKMFNRSYWLLSHVYVCLGIVPNFDLFA